MAGTNDDELTVQVDHDGAVTVVTVTGEVDIATSGSLREAISDVFGHGAGHTVVFDLAATTFLDSSGLAVLISVARDGRAVFLREPSDAVRMVVKASGLSDFLPVEP